MEMVRFNYDKDKSIASILFILNKLGKTDFHKVFKILYFADQKHLTKYGNPITGDIYIAMKNGPVPSKVYDILKTVRDNVKFNVTLKELTDLFEIHGNHEVTAKVNANLDFLSESDIECLESSIEENKNLSFDELTEKSHKDAWNKASRDNELSFLDIAIEGGANNVMVSYIETVSENQRFALA
jgi:uncharacterized phage-associated protein